MAPATRASASGPASFPLDRLARQRAATYDLLGSLFLYPTRDQLSRLPAVAELLESSSDARGFAYFPRLHDLCGRVRGAAGAEPQRLEQEYTALFLAGTARAVCPPYESAYTERGDERGLVSVEVGRAYAAAGITLAADGDLPDHVALELGFLSVLCDDEAHAWHGADPDCAVDLLRCQRDFHEQHLQRWLPEFRSRLVRSAADGSLYAALARAAHAFAVHDHDLVRALCARTPLLAP